MVDITQDQVAELKLEALTELASVFDTAADALDEFGEDHRPRVASLLREYGVVILLDFRLSFVMGPDFIEKLVKVLAGSANMIDGTPEPVRFVSEALRVQAEAVRDVIVNGEVPDFKENPRYQQLVADVEADRAVNPDAYPPGYAGNDSLRA